MDLLHQSSIVKLLWNICHGLDWSCPSSDWPMGQQPGTVLVHGRWNHGSLQSRMAFNDSVIFISITSFHVTHFFYESFHFIIISFHFKSIIFHFIYESFHFISFQIYHISFQLWIISFQINHFISYMELKINQSMKAIPFRHFTHSGAIILTVSQSAIISGHVSELFQVAG